MEKLIGIISKKTSRTNLQFKMKVYLVLILSYLVIIRCDGQVKIPESNWGGVSGGIDMFLYTPNGLSGPAPVVVALHGCSETPTSYAQSSGWNELADLHGFYIIYPFSSLQGQELIGACFNWWEDGFACTSTRDQEAADIIKMLDYLNNKEGGNACATYVTGFSAGAGMTSVLCAKYPQYFAGGAPIAGVPHGVPCAFSLTAMGGSYDLIPSVWGNLVFNENPGYNGSYPKMFIMSGFIDPTINYNNFDEMIEQWTTVHGLDQISDQTIYPFNFNATVTQGNHMNPNGDIKVQTFTISNLGHAIPVDAFNGIAGPEGGIVSSYSYHVDGLWSSYWISNFWGLLSNNHCLDVCMDSLSLHNSHSYGSISYKTSDWIQSTENIFGSASVEYNARNCVLLDANFEVNVGALFEAVIMGCTP